MPMPVAQWFARAVELYAAIGVVHGVAFVARGVTRLDANAVGTGWGFRALIFPGSVLFWPLLAGRWAGRRRS